MLGWFGERSALSAPRDGPEGAEQNLTEAPELWQLPGGELGWEMLIFGLSTGASPSYGSGGYPGDTELLTTFSWDDQNVRRVFIRKVRQGQESSQASEGPACAGFGDPRITCPCRFTPSSWSSSWSPLSSWLSSPSGRCWVCSESPERALGRFLAVVSHLRLFPSIPIEKQS